MSDNGFNLSPERKAALTRGFERLIADCAKTEAEHLFETREAFKSIVGAIKGAGDLDKLDHYQLRRVLDEIMKLAGYVEYQLNEIDNAEWEEARYGSGDED